eukprot:CAMPEP_0196573626 /NCGR_PEP_ID=MMETSP1081-20130531/3497_1 /TAXON_ID=36882 /ORGANISM="Pyramimonas amylifera, Strain CCMP720" /LENGTH=561 /DNA_ID=CAMNT_0041891401 /DNA_START=106 /DNA_END=1791 /DNA_ORIENTATION=-
MSGLCFAAIQSNFQILAACENRRSTTAETSSRKCPLSSRKTEYTRLRASRVGCWQGRNTCVQVRAMLPDVATTGVYDPAVLLDSLHALSYEAQYHADHLSNHLYTISDSAAALLDDAAPAIRDDGWLKPISSTLKSILEAIASVYKSLGVPNAAGWSIITLTFLTKAITYPLAKTQVESTMAQANLAPMLEAIKARYKDDKEKVNKETIRVREEAGVNPLAGCFPSIIQLPVFLGLYRALVNASMDNDYNESFFWIPSLAGPTQFGSSDTISWFWPFINGAPPVGWEMAQAYLVVPVLVVIAQLVSQELLKPDTEPDEDAQGMLLLLKALPFFLGWFALNVPAGLTLYWLANAIITTATQYYLRFGGGADPIVKTKLAAPKVKLGTAIRTNAIPRAKSSASAPQTVDLLASIDLEATKALNVARLAAIAEAKAAPPAAVEVPKLTTEPESALAGMFAGDDMGIAPAMSAAAPVVAAPAPVVSKAHIKFEMKLLDPLEASRAPQTSPPPKGPPMYAVELSALTSAVQVAATESRNMKQLVSKRCKRKRNPEERMLVAPILIQ